MKFTALFAAMALAITTGQALAEDSVPIRHAQGETEVAANPSKVIVFDLASLDTLTTLGVPVVGVPGSLLPEYIAAKLPSDVAKVGTIFEPDFEAVNALTPDLIVIGGRSAPKFADLSRMAPTVDMTIGPKNYLQNIRDNAETLGKLFGKQDAVAAELTRQDAALARLRELSAGAGKALIVMTSGGRMSTHGPGSRFGVVFDEFGFQPAAAGGEAGTHGQPISNEFILEANPDWLLVVDRDAAIGQEGEAAAKLLDNELVRQTNAWKNGHVVYLDPTAWYLVGGGLTAINAAIEQLSGALAAK